MRTLRLSPEATADLDAACDWLAERNPRAAERLVERFRQVFDLLLGLPRVGAPRDAFREGLRRVIVRPYLVYYRADDDLVEIVRVLHGSRDHDTILRGED